MPSCLLIQTFYYLLWNFEWTRNKSFLSLNWFSNTNCFIICCFLFFILEVKANKMNRYKMSWMFFFLLRCFTRIKTLIHLDSQSRWKCEHSVLLLFVMMMMRISLNLPLFQNMRIFVFAKIHRIALSLSLNRESNSTIFRMIFLQWMKPWGDKRHFRFCQNFCKNDRDKMITTQYHSLCTFLAILPYMKLY